MSKLRLSALILFCLSFLFTNDINAQLVINEIDYDQAGTDTSEFLEIKNVGVVGVNLGSYDVVMINGANGGSSSYATISLPNTMLMAGQYFVICANAANTANCDLDVSPETNLIQNGAPDAVAITDTNGIIDVVSYEGDVVMPYVEGSGAGLEDIFFISRLGISRFPDGVDTDMNNVDFSPRCISPGATNLMADTLCTITTAIQDNSDEEDKLLVFPNPATDQLFYYAPHIGDANVRLMDMKGNIVLERFEANGSNGSFNLSNIAAGTYTIQVISNSTVINKRVLITPDR